MHAHPNAYNPQTEELDFIAGDQPAAVSQRAVRDQGGAQIGGQSTVRLDKAALGHPEIRYSTPTRDFVIEADVYPLLGAAMFEQGAAEALEVIIICPKCQHELRITSDRKAIEFTPGTPIFDPIANDWIVRGVLSVERFQCTWEKDTQTNVTGHGENLCRWRAVIDKNVARDV